MDTECEREMGTGSFFMTLERRRIGISRYIGGASSSLLLAQKHRLRADREYRRSVNNLRSIIISRVAGMVCAN
jgi:hypothetical protein